MRSYWIHTHTGCLKSRGGTNSGEKKDDLISNKKEKSPRHYCTSQSRKRERAAAGTSPCLELRRGRLLPERSHPFPTCSKQLWIQGLQHVNSRAGIQFLGEFSSVLGEVFLFWTPQGAKECFIKYLLCMRKENTREEDTRWPSSVLQRELLFKLGSPEAQLHSAILEREKGRACNNERLFVMCWTGKTEAAVC